MKKSNKTYRNPPVIITLIDKDHACHIFEVNYNGVISTIQCFLTIEDNILYLSEIDIEGPGTGFYGSALIKMIDEAGKEFCKIYNTDSVVLQGGKRTTGRFIGSFPKPRIVKSR